MIRLTVLAALVLAARAPERAAAQPPVPGSVKLVDAKVVKGKIQWDECQLVPVTKEIEVEVLVNGKAVREKRKITAYEKVTIVREVELKGVKATTVNGKAIAADKLADLLKEPTSVVVVSGPLSEKRRALFKDTTVFIELPAPAPTGPVG